MQNDDRDFRILQLKITFTKSNYHKSARKVIVLSIIHGDKAKFENSKRREQNRAKGVKGRRETLPKDHLRSIRYSTIYFPCYFSDFESLSPYYFSDLFLSLSSSVLFLHFLAPLLSATRVCACSVVVKYNERHRQRRKT